MGALKGRFQCLRGLRVTINNKRQHIAACQWMTIAIILHNIIVEVEGTHADYFVFGHTQAQEQEDHGVQDEEDLIQEGDFDQGGEAKRKRLIEELLASKNL